MLIANAGNINLKSIAGNGVSFCASGNISFSGATQLGDNLWLIVVAIPRFISDR
jgi:hypothetical protein